jgi:hypothetical protein
LRSAQKIAESRVKAVPVIEGSKRHVNRQTVPCSFFSFVILYGLAMIFVFLI